MPKFLKLCERSLGEKTITEAGIYNAVDDGFDGYAQVDVQVTGGGSSGLSFPVDSAITTQMDMGDGQYACFFCINMPKTEEFAKTDDIGAAVISYRDTPANMQLSSGSYSDVGGPDILAKTGTCQLATADGSYMFMAAVFVAVGVSWQSFNPFAGDLAYTEDPSVISVCGYSMAMDMNAGTVLNPAPLFDSMTISPPTAESARQDTINAFVNGTPPAINFSDFSNIRSYAFAGMTFNSPVDYPFSSVNSDVFLGATFEQGLTLQYGVSLYDEAFMRATIRNTSSLTVDSLGASALQFVNAPDTTLYFSSSNAITFNRNCLTDANLYAISSSTQGEAIFDSTTSDYSFSGSTGFGSMRYVRIQSPSITFNGYGIIMNNRSGSDTLEELYLIESDGWHGVNELRLLRNPAGGNNNTSTLNKLVAPTLSLITVGEMQSFPTNITYIDIFDFGAGHAYEFLYRMEYLETLILRNDGLNNSLTTADYLRYINANSPIAQGLGAVYVPDDVVAAYQTAVAGTAIIIRPISQL